MAKVVKKKLGHVVGDMNLDTIIEYEVPETYTPPVSGITVRGFFGSVTRGLMDLFAGKANKSDALQTLEQISANTDSNKIAGAMALRELNNNMNSKLSKLPAKILYGSGLYNIDGSGVVRIPVAGISSGVPMVIIKSAYVQIGNCGYDGTSIFVQLYINNGAGVPSPGQVYADYIIVGK